MQQQSHGFGVDRPHSKNGTRNTFHFPKFFETMSMARAGLNNEARYLTAGFCGVKGYVSQEDGFQRFCEFEDQISSDFTSTSSNGNMGSPGSSETESDDQSAVQLFQQAVPSHLLIVALLEHICTFYDNQQGKSNELFQTLCQHLSAMKLIPQFAIHDEFRLIRDKYRSALTDLMQFALLTSQKQRRIEDIERPMPWYPHGSSMKTQSDRSSPMVHSPSRYRDEFEEIEQLGEGGFGAVFEAINKLDGKGYAVKKVVLNQTNPIECLKTLREVKVLANLDHANIVRYHAAWLEYVIAEKRNGNKGLFTDPELSGESLSSSNYFRTMDSITESYDFDYGDENSSVDKSDSFISFENDEGSKSSVDLADVASTSLGAQPRIRQDINAANIHVLQSGHFSSEVKGTVASKNVVRRQRGVLTLSSDLKAVYEKDQVALYSRPPSQNNGHKDDLSTIAIVMHIQMELCSNTLKHWLTDRNEDVAKYGRHVDWNNNARIFEQLLHGVDYIHRQGLMHRDLKPCNVFLNHKDSLADIGVKIGDLGLARKSAVNPVNQCKKNELVELVDSESGVLATKGVGTVTYAAPEQLSTNAYTKKADIYSLGIILFELFVPFKTGMERHESFRDLRQGVLPRLLQEKWPHVSELIGKMTDPKASKRPEAKAILKMSYFQDKDSIISLLRLDLQEKDREIEQLKKALRAMKLKASCSQKN